ncbi:MAG: nuclear transport factor 2 family protein [Pseudomonadota bacterium]
MAQYTDDYQAALMLHNGSERGIEHGLDLFKRTYANLADTETSNKVSQLYANQLYFNDTIKTIRSREELTDYMEKTSNKVQTSYVEVDQVIRDGADVFLRWTMHFESSAYGINIDSETIGMTHLRFNEDGQVVLHQDFWDSAAGIYSHLPIVGFFVRRAQAMLD